MLQQQIRLVMINRPRRRFLRKYIVVVYVFKIVLYTHNHKTHLFHYLKLFNHHDMFYSCLSMPSE